MHSSNRFFFPVQFTIFRFFLVFIFNMGLGLQEGRSHILSSFLLSN